MTLVELNKIEQVLKENRKAKEKERALFTEKMHEKYSKDCWRYLETVMDNTEKATYETLRDEYMKARQIYSSFVEHNWQ